MPGLLKEIAQLAEADCFCVPCEANPQYVTLSRSCQQVEDMLLQYVELVAAAPLLLQYEVTSMEHWTFSTAVNMQHSHAASSLGMCSFITLSLQMKASRILASCTR